MPGGAAIGDGRLPGVRAKVYDYFPAFVAHHDVDPRLRGTTVEDLLAMSTLWECDDENPFSAGHEERMYVGERWLDFALALPVKGFAPWMARPEDSPHGRAFAYCTANSFVLGAVLERATGQPLADYAAHALERPLGITHSQWNRSPEGIGMGGGGTRYRSRDLARLGQLVLDGGRWQGRQLVPRDYVAAMLSPQATAGDGSDYGYQWWGLKLTVGGQPQTVWAMSGNGGNYVFLLPQQRAVAVVGQLVACVRVDEHIQRAVVEGQPAHHLVALVGLQTQHRQAEGEAAQQQHHRFRQHEAQLEQFLARRTVGGAVEQHPEGGKQHREDQAVAHQVHPEPDDGLAAVVVVLMGVVVMTARELPVLRGSGQGIATHALAPCICAKCASSMRFTSAAGT